MKTIYLIGIAMLCLSTTLKSQFCDDAETLECSATLMGSNGTGIFEADSYCDNPFAIGYFSSEKVYIIEPTSTALYNISLVITGGDDLDIFLLTSECDKDICIADMTQVDQDTHTSILEAGETYYLVVDGATNGAGEPIISEFNISVDCTPLEFPCDSEQIECGTTFSSNDTGSSTLESYDCLLYTSPSPRDLSTSRMPSSA